MTTPLLGASSVTDLHINSLALEVSGQTLYLQTSPEFYMKRLLAADSGPVYQICQAFRDGESGRFHNVEFTLVEWYQPDYSMDQLMRELEELFNSLVSISPIASASSATTNSTITSAKKSNIARPDGIARRSYKVLFESQLGVNPHRLGDKELMELCRRRVAADLTHLLSTGSRRTRENCLDLLFTHEIQPSLVEPTFVTHYPASQAGLAETGSLDGDEVALRFELFCQGVELANGYFELRDAEELRSRMETDNADRLKSGLASVAADEKLLDSMLSGLPVCSGVALGLDRLIMLLTNSGSLDEVIPFSSKRL